MSKFPIDAPKQRAIKAFQILGFHMVREREHISMERLNPDGSKTPLTMPNHPKIKACHSPNDLYTIRNFES